MRISDYAFLSDSQSSALVGRDGSIDWFCLPRFDSPSVFARLLDENAGHWFIRPAGEFESERSYVGYSLVLRSVFRSKTGAVALTDALMLEPGSREHEIGKRVPHVLLRSIEGLQGEVDMEMDFRPRFEYGLTDPRFDAAGRGWRAWGSAVDLELKSSIETLHRDGGIHACFRVRAGEKAVFSLAYGGSYCGEPLHEIDVESSLQDTIEAWHSWMDIHQGYQGLYREEVRRSALVLQGLTYQPSGAVIAAATTSLPEDIGGSRNWDYRYSWLRDASLVLQALWVGACPDEPERFFEWIDQSGRSTMSREMQIMYGVEGERDLTEHFMENLAGFEGSRPVRVGNDAWKQRQIDVYGNVLDAAYLLRDKFGSISGRLRSLLVSLADQAAVVWREPDRGMWELRDKERHYLSSKLMCWVALARAESLAPELEVSRADQERWARVRDEIRKTIVSEGWNDEAGAYTGSFGSENLDASVLLMPIVGFLPATDPRMKATIEAIDSRLGRNGLIRRWPEEEGGFILCSYWMAQCLALSGEFERAAERFDAITSYANDLGLLPEEIDPGTGAMLGNYPQAFSHIGLVNTAWLLTNKAPEVVHP